MGWLDDAVGGLASLFGGDGGSWIPDAGYSFGVDPVMFEDGGAASVSPDWAGGLSLDGAAPSGADLMQQVALSDPNATSTPVTLGVADQNGDPMRPLMVNPSQNFAPTGRMNADGSIDTSGFARTTNAFGGGLSSAGLNQAASRLLDAVNGVRPIATGGGPTNIALPKLDVPTSGIVPSAPVPGMAASPVPQTAGSAQGGGFTPMTANVTTAQSPQDPNGLRRLFEQMGVR